MPNAVLLIDDDKDLLLLLGQTVSAFSTHRPVKMTGYAEVLQRREEALDCILAIIDINLGANLPNGVEVCRWLLDNNFPGRICFLTGHARAHPLVLEAAKLKDIRIYSKPIGISVLKKIIDGGS